MHTYINVERERERDVCMHGDEREIDQSPAAPVTRTFRGFCAIIDLRVLESAVI